MQEFFITATIGIGLIVLCSLSIYEVLRLTWARLPRFSVAPRLRVLLVIGIVFLAHIANIWIFGVAYYALAHAGMGTLSGAVITSGIYHLDFFGYLYFSAVSYSTVGFGDVTPEGALRMIAGVEALTGFILIGWTVSFTYLTMEKFWELH